MGGRLEADIGMGGVMTHFARKCSGTPRDLTDNGSPQGDQLRQVAATVTGPMEDDLPHILPLPSKTRFKRELPPVVGDIEEGLLDGFQAVEAEPRDGGFLAREHCISRILCPPDP